MSLANAFCAISLGKTSLQKRCGAESCMGRRSCTHPWADVVLYSYGINVRVAIHSSFLFVEIHPRLFSHVIHESITPATSSLAHTGSYGTPHTRLAPAVAMYEPHG